MRRAIEVRNTMLRLNTLAACAVAPWLRAYAARFRHDITVLMYHEIGDDDVDLHAWTIVRASDFRRQIEVLRSYFDVVALDEARAIMARTAPPPRPLAVLTFDDGHSGWCEHLLPIVEREALPVTLYLATGHVESGCSFWFDRIINAVQIPVARHLDLHRYGLGRYSLHPIKHGARKHAACAWASVQSLLQDIKQLPLDAIEAAVCEVETQLGPPVRGACLRPLTPAQVGHLGRCPHVVFGAHSHGHEILTRIDGASARRSIETGRARILEWSGQHAQHFAYPGGSMDAATRAMVTELGFRTAMSTRRGTWDGRTSLMEIPRMDVGRDDRGVVFRANLMGGVRRWLTPWGRN